MHSFPKNLLIIIAIFLIVVSILNFDFNMVQFEPVQSISIGEINNQNLPEGYDVTMIRESDLTDKSELVKGLYQNHKYILIYKEDGTLSIEKASNALGFSGGSQENNLEWKPIAVGFIKKADGNPLVHNFYSKTELDIRKHPRQMEQLLSKDLKDSKQSCGDARYLAVSELPPKAAIYVAGKSRNLGGKSRKAIPCKLKQGDGFFISCSIGSSEFGHPSPYAC